MTPTTKTMTKQIKTAINKKCFGLIANDASFITIWACAEEEANKNNTFGKIKRVTRQNETRTAPEFRAKTLALCC